jgi:hypothetical protein
MGVDNTLFGNISEPKYLGLTLNVNEVQDKIERRIV